MRVKVLLCVVLVVGPGALAASPPKGETVPRSLREEKPLEKLETALQRADLVVVGKLGKLTPLKGGTVVVSGDIAVAEVLKGPADAKSVTLRSLNPEQVKEKGPGAFQGIFWPEGKDGIWILRKHWEGQHYVADNPVHFQPKANEQEVKRILRAWANAKSATTEPVVRDGIALSVSVEPLVLASGDMLFYTVTLQNVSDKDIRMYRTNRDDLRFVALATGKVWVTQASRFPPPVAPPALSTFKPKEVWVWTTEIAINSKFVEAGGKPEDAREGLPAGRYRLEYSTTFMDHYPGGKAVYTGTIQAKPVELEIKPATTATKSGAASEMPNDTLAFFGEMDRCGIILLDVHPLHGGTELHLDGSGVCIVRIVQREQEQRFRISPSGWDEPKGLLWHCVELDLVTVKIKERAGVPGEARPRIILRNAAGETRTLAKWANDKVPQFDAIYGALMEFRKKTVGLKLDYEGRYQRDWRPPPGKGAGAKTPADPATQPAAAVVDPKSASLADALTDWIALLEKDDAKTATARWATNAAVGKVTAEWKALRECHKQHDYRRWIENSSDEPTAQLVPGGAKRIGKDTTFRVGGHGFGHLHIMWKKTHSGWRIASILQCM